MKYTSYDELLRFALEKTDTFSLAWRNFAYKTFIFIALILIFVMLGSYFFA